jgi:beta-galactosidase
MRLGTRLLAIILYLSGVALATSVVASPVRQRFRMDADWRFSLDTGDNSVLHGVSIDNWVWIADAAAPGDADKMAAPDLDTSGGGWAKVSVGMDVFHGRIGFAWYRTVLPALKIPNSRDCAALRFASVDDNATVYLNGKRLLHHEGWSDPFEVYLDKAWNPEGPNTLAVLVENTGGAGGIMGPVTLSIARKPDGASVPPQAKMDFKDHAWKVVHLPNDYVVESPFSRTADMSHGFHIVQPAWYRKTFTLPASFRGKTLALQFDGIYRDAKIWLNGRFLGEHKSGDIGVR